MAGGNPRALRRRVRHGGLTEPRLRQRGSAHWHVTRNAVACKICGMSRLGATNLPSHLLMAKVTARSPEAKREAMRAIREWRRQQKATRSSTKTSR